MLGIPIAGGSRHWRFGMPRDIDEADIDLRRHRFGRINRRIPIGPVRWNHYDLFWLHEGRATVVFPEHSARLDLLAPTGVLILPGTLFQGATTGAFATASVCHFAISGHAVEPGFRVPHADEALHIQNLVRLAMHLARLDRDTDLPRRRRLVLALLDGFTNGQEGPATVDEDRLAFAWQQAEENLHRMRTLADVAAVLGVSESSLRAMHRNAWQTSAGEHLRELRLTRAEELLVTTGKTLAAIAAEVGYGHASTLGAAFRARRGKTPGHYRRWSNPFA